MKYLYLVLSLISVSTFAQKVQNVRINLKDQNTKAPISGATVFIKNTQLAGIADEKGHTIIENVPLGRHEIEITSVGYTKLILKELILENAKEIILDLELQASSKTLEQVVITAATPNMSNAITSINTITFEQIMRFPVTFFDPARLAFSFAGVANTNDQANGMAIRGNTPESMQWKLEGVEIVNPNHLSNAGTFSDQPTQTGGGTNILSAQMLGHMNFLTGAFPAEYGNTLAGVMDMTYRVGNNKKFQHTAQIGLIGVDLSSEGPLNKAKGSSYLFNYRYSFTGLLGLMGIDFGGESIKFQDLAFNFNFPTRRLGTFMIFGMGGNSSNEYVPNADQTLWESEKDFNNIDFYSRMGVVGLKHTLKLSENWNLKTVIANSGLENLRDAYKTDPAFNISYTYQARNIVGFSSIVSGNLNKLFALKTGVNINHYFNEFNFQNSGDAFYSFDGLMVQPFVRITNKEKTRFSYNVGLVLPHYTLSEKTYLEPRLGLAYALTSKFELKASYGLHSYESSNQNAFALPYRPVRAHHFNLGYQYQLSENQEVYGEVFYQNLFNTPVSNNQYLSVLNGYENTVVELATDASNLNNQGRNYGIELNYRKYLSKGFFALINATIYKAEFLAFDKKYYQTRFSGNHILNLTIGKEWTKSPGKFIGLNTRIAWLGGFRNYEILEAASIVSKSTIYNYAKPLIEKNPDYFRPDLRVYFKKSKDKFSRTISVDIQNFTGQKNLAYQYYDAFLEKITPKYQLGIIPMLNYRIEF
ncbi:MAG: TonB-dependent receptor [Leadbetterella sp.]|jgi:hypothetical protein|nr:TonB-dependent receptor [Leadbetterella sp.]